MLWHIELQFYIWLCFTVLQIKCDCRQFGWIFVGVMPLLGLRILEIHSFPRFSPACFDIFSWNFAYDFVWCTIDQVRVSSIYARLAFRLSIQFLHFLSTCIDKFSWNLKFDVGFFNAFLLQKYYTGKNSLSMFMTGVLCIVCGAQESGIFSNFKMSYLPFIWFETQILTLQLSLHKLSKYGYLRVPVNNKQIGSIRLPKWNV